MQRIRVVAAALIDASDRVLIAERPAGRPLAGRWEFPGGKVAGGESDAAALARELREELGIELIAGQCLMQLTHRYGEQHVDLSMWVVERFSGEPRALEGQRLKWVPRVGLAGEDILEADRPFIEALQRLKR